MRLARPLSFLCLPMVAACVPAQTASVAPYKVSPDFREVANRQEFLKHVPLGNEHKAKLAKNLFVVAPGGDEQLYWIYGANDYLNLPSFVTTDSVLHLYHVFFDATLRKAEETAFLPRLRKLTKEMLSHSLQVAGATKDPVWRQAAQRNVAYFAVASRLLGDEPKLPLATRAMVDTELNLIREARGFETSPVNGGKLDYSQFIVRGHYTRSEKLGVYFKAMSWYGLAPFDLFIQNGARMVANDAAIRRSALLVRSLYNQKLMDEWTAIYEPTELYVGASNTVTPAQVRKSLETAYGKLPSLTDLPKSAKYSKLVGELRALPGSRILAKRRGETPGGLKFRFMGKRYIPDSEILQRLTDEKRDIPTGLDVMAVLGSSRAAAIVDGNPKLYNPRNWPGYAPERKKLEAEFAKLPEATWKSNLYYGWLYALKALLAPAPEGYPSFMRNEAWQGKSLMTALGSWAELRHDTVLYGEQSIAEMGDGEEPPFVRGYVEPNPEFYSRLLDLTRASRLGLEKRRMIAKDDAEQFTEFENTLEFLLDVSQRELRNEKLSREEHERIRHIEGTLEYLALQILLGKGATHSMLSEDDKDMAIVADVHTGDGRVLEAAVGRSDDIIAIVPIEGKLYFARGAVFSYYEFAQPIAQRMTNKQWRERLTAGKAPARPAWAKSYFVNGRVRKDDD